MLPVGVGGDHAAALRHGDVEVVQPRLQGRPFAQVHHMVQNGHAGHGRQAGEERLALLAAAVVDHDDLGHSPAALQLLNQVHEAAIGIVGGNQRRNVHVRPSPGLPSVVAERCSPEMGLFASVEIS